MLPTAPPSATNRIMFIHRPRSSSRLPRQGLADLDLQAARHGAIVSPIRHLIRQIALARRERIRLIVRIPIVPAVSEALHQTWWAHCGSAAAHPACRTSQHPPSPLPSRHTRHCSWARRRDTRPRWQSRARLPGCRAGRTPPRHPASTRKPRIRQPDILHRHPHHPARDVERIAAAIQHPAEPIQRAIRITAPHGLVQRRDLVIELVAALVEPAAGAARPLPRQFAKSAGGRPRPDSRPAPTCSVRAAPSPSAARAIRSSASGSALMCSLPRPRSSSASAAAQQCRDVLDRQRPQHVDTGSGQQAR